MKINKLFRYIIFGLMMGIIAVFSAMIAEKSVLAANQAIVQDDLGGTQEQTQAQPSEANPMQEPEQIEEAQNIGRSPQTDETPPPNEPDEIEETEAPPINQ